MSHQVEQKYHEQQSYHFRECLEVVKRQKNKQNNNKNGRSMNENRIS